MMVAKWERDETTYQTHHPSKSWNVPPNYWGFSSPLYILYLHKRKLRKLTLPGHKGYADAGGISSATMGANNMSRVSSFSAKCCNHLDEMK